MTGRVFFVSFLPRSTKSSGMILVGESRPQGEVQGCTSTKKGLAHQR